MEKHRLNNMLDSDNKKFLRNHHNNHHHHHSNAMHLRKQSLNTSSTKLNPSLSPHGSWRTRNNFLAARAHEPMTYSKTQYTKEEILERKREGRLLNQIDEERTGAHREPSSGSTHKGGAHHNKTASSYPTLLFNRPSFNSEKVDIRCTSV